MIRHKTIIGVIIFLLMAPFLFSQEIPFKGGEKVKYKAYYNLGFFWLHAGNVLFKATESSYRNQKSFHFKAFGASLPSYDFFFKVRDYYQSYATKKNLKPLYFERNTSEGGYKVHNEYFFDYRKKVIYSQSDNSGKKYEEDTLLNKGTVLDVLTIIYRARRIDFNQYEKGEKIPFSLIIDNEIFEDLYLRYLGKEEVRLHRTKEKYRCHKFSAMLVEGTIFSGGEDLTVWVTDDKNKIPVLIKAKILVGSVKGVFQSAENLKFPLTARIK